MAFNIEEFNSYLNKHNGPMRTNKFKVQFGMPASMLQNNDTSAVHRSLEFWCQEAQIPGYQLLTHDVRRYTYGTNESRPFAPNFVPMQLIFLNDNNSEIWNFFNAWLQSIMPHDMESSMQDASAYGNKRVYELSYKKEYVVPMLITVYNEEGEPTTEVEVREAFPVNINAINLSWADQNSHANFAVIIEYLDWKFLDPQFTASNF